MKKMMKRLGFLFKFHKSIPFIADFFRSTQIRGRTKFLYVAVIAAYILIPFDVIPDFFYLFGFVDDITVAAFLLQQMVKAAPDSLKEKHNFE
ncbi:YkvA family protein [Lentibacillus amyloliquefaciens]|uniref:DUF1232 domain-containing protein n=1 Tax=Lentibacillus amyloliquefaciens TaxID=1472767 RepID=A0A0U4FN56_9BACI|nr:DUF1232 domain-containing protein [Lentibacillus amyloliquefaciens]ALX49172.1 hypothetical protein AOX59_11590 [Lentibacillus amyloliquefaciens]